MQQDVYKRQDRMNTQVRRINNYIEQILYYVRSENAEKDYIINDARLSKIISNVALPLIFKKFPFLITPESSGTCSFFANTFTVIEMCIRDRCMSTQGLLA